MNQLTITLLNILIENKFTARPNIIPEYQIMNFLSLSEVHNLFADLDHLNTVEDLKVIHPFLISVMPEEVALKIRTAVENQNFDTFIEAFHEADEHGITWFDHLNLSDLNHDLLTATHEDGVFLKQLLQIVELYEILENNNYSGGEVDSIALISAPYFETFIRESEVEDGSVSSHLQDYVDWGTFAHNVRNADYGSVNVSEEIRHTLQLENTEFYYRK